MYRNVARKGGASPQAVLRGAMRVLESDGMVRNVGRDRWTVASGSDSERRYRVDVTEDGIKCECEFHQKRRGAMCKHAKAIELLILREMEAVEPRGGRPVTVPEVTVPECPGAGCAGGDAVRDGRRPRRRRGPAQRFRCRECGTRFSGPAGFRGRHHEPKTVLLAVMLFAMGTSPAGIVLVLREGEGVRVDRCTVQRWAGHYVGLVERYTGGISVRAGGKWSVDEKYLRIGRAEHWLFAVLDTSTRFVLSLDVSPEKLAYDARGLFRGAADRAGRRPAILVSDKLKGFGKAFGKVFYRRRDPRPRHFSECHIRNECCTNNAHERFNSTIGERVRTARALGAADSVIITASIIHYNFVRPHQGLGGETTPAKAAGITIEGPSVWRTLIENAAIAASSAA